MRKKGKVNKPNPLYFGLSTSPIILLNNIYIYIYIYCHESNLKNMIGIIMQLLRPIDRIGSGLSDRSSSLLRAKIRCCKSHDRFGRWITDSSAIKSHLLLVEVLSSRRGAVGKFYCHSKQDIYILSSTDRLFRCITTLQCG